MGYCRKCGIVLNKENKGEYCPVCRVEVEKKCEWCGKPFIPNHGNEKYCNDEHKLEAKREKTRNRRNLYYKKNKGTAILSQLGTTTMSKHPNKDLDKEKKVIKNEIKKISVTTVYKGKYQYSKKSAKFTAQIQPTGQYGIQLTHNYANLNDYYQTALNYLINQKTDKCPECQERGVTKDMKHAEILCDNCGLVLMGPYDLRVVYPFMEYPKPREKDETIDPMSYYSKPKTSNFNHKKYSRDTTPIRVVCKKCHKPSTIAYNEKEEYRCTVCGSRVMGAGICMPHNFDDEFSRGKEKYISYDMRTTEERLIGE